MSQDLIFRNEGTSGRSAMSGIDVQVDTQAALSLVVVTNLNDDVRALVGAAAGGAGQSQNSLWQLVTQVGGAPALLSQEVIASSAAGRVWQRLFSVTSARWLQQGAWAVDPAAGNDENVGGVASPLATYGEFIRRKPFLYVPTTVTILGTLLDSDNLSHEPEARWHQALSGTYPTLTIAGTRTVGANNIVATSADETGNAAPLVNAGVALTPGALIIATNGASVNATAVVVALVAGTNYRTSPWRSSAGSRVAPPAIGDTIAAITLPTVNRVAIGGTELANGALISNLNIKLTILTRPNSFTTCTFPAGAGAVPVTAGGNQLFNGCGLLTNSIGTSNPGTVTAFNQCGLIRGAAGTMTCQRGCAMSFTDTVLQNWGIDCSANSAQIQCGGWLVFESLGIFNATAAVTAFKCRTGGQVSIFGTFYGQDPGGASVGTDCREGGNIYVKSTVTPTITAATELIFDGAATANAPPPLATGVIPVATQLTTWAQWAAALFNRFVLGYATGSRIISYV